MAKNKKSALSSTNSGDLFGDQLSTREISSGFSKTIEKFCDLQNYWLQTASSWWNVGSRRRNSGSLYIQNIWEKRK